MMANNGTPGFMAYFDTWELILKLDDSKAVSFFRAALQYAKTGELPDFTDVDAVAWGLIQQGLDRDKTRYEQTSTKRRYANYCKEEGRAGREPVDFSTWSHMEPYGSTWNLTLTPTPTITPTIEPTTASTPCADAPEAGAPALEEVEDYVRANGFSMDPSAFFDYYSARGWIVSGEPVADWKALCRSWQSREKQKPPAGEPNTADDTMKTLEQIDALRAKMNREEPERRS